jgi:hypothetical protein
MVGRWDMEGEMSLLVDQVMPVLKRTCDDLYCTINFVSLEVRLACPYLQSSPIPMGLHHVLTRT